MTPSRQARSDRVRNRDALVLAAAELMPRHGVDVPLDLVAKRAGLGNATLYRHFPQRRDLITAVLLANLQRSDAVLVEAAGRESGWVGLTEFLTWLFGQQIENPAYMSALRAVPSGVDDEVDRLRDTTVHTLEEMITRAKTEGAMRADRWIEDVFLLLALNEHLTHGGHRDPVAASRRLLELALDSLSTQVAAATASVAVPDTVLSLRRSLGQELAGLSAQETGGGRTR